MAATQSGNFPVEMDPYTIIEVTLSSMVADQLESIVPNGALIATGKAMTPFLVQFQVTTPPDSHGAIGMSKESASATTGAVGLRFYGTDLTGAVVKVLFFYRAMKAGGISA